MITTDSNLEVEGSLTRRIEALTALVAELRQVRVSVPSDEADRALDAALGHVEALLSVGRIEQDGEKYYTFRDTEGMAVDDGPQFGPIEIKEHPCPPGNPQFSATYAGISGWGTSEGDAISQLKATLKRRRAEQ
jgi:hypothetical protein